MTDTAQGLRPSWVDDNLFPFEIMLGVVGALAYLGLLAVTRRLLAKA